MPILCLAIAHCSVNALITESPSMYYLVKFYNSYDYECISLYYMYIYVCAKIEAKHHRYRPAVSVILDLTSQLRSEVDITPAKCLLILIVSS